MNNNAMVEGRHVTQEEMDGLLVGDAMSDVVARHLRLCAACTTELAGMRGSIGLLRESLTARAQMQAGSSLLLQRTSLGVRPLRRVPAYVALAASVAIAALMIPLSRVPRVPVVITPVAAPVRTIESDEALLQEIDQQLSASVPAALEPLADPAADQTSTNSNTSHKRN